MTESNSIKLIAVKVNFDFNFKKYLYLLNTHSQSKIFNYKFWPEQIIAFTSEILKYYYLASYLEINPKNISLNYNEYGRPHLIENLLNTDFNISHSGDYVIMVIAHNTKVGIDIEQINHSIEVKQISNIAFSEVEKKWVGNDIDKFFIIWTKREALLKAWGTGFRNNDYNKINLIINEPQKLGWYIHSQCIFNTYYLSICLQITDYCI